MLSRYPFSFNTCLILEFSLCKLSLFVIMEYALLNKQETTLSHHQTSYKESVVSSLFNRAYLMHIAQVNGVFDLVSIIFYCFTTFSSCIYKIVNFTSVIFE